MDEILKDEFLSKVKTAFTEYSAQKRPIDEQMKENHLWFRQKQSQFKSSGEREKKKNGQPLARSGYVFNAVINKHADAMDAYPDINILPREEGDEQEAKALTEILPLVLEMACFRDTYSKAWWDKAIDGTGVYGIFFNPDLNGGLGDIEIKRIDMKKLVWQPYVDDIQDSKYLFYTYYMDKEDFLKVYGRDKFEEASAQPENTDDAINNRRQMVINDCYYKKNGKLHLLKYSGGAVLEKTEGQEEYAEGIYQHGLYPFVFDVYYPVEDSPCGFGIVDAVKHVQAYIDKLDDGISDNAISSGKQRFIVRKDGKINVNSLLDESQVVIETEGSLNDEQFRQLQARPLPAFVMAHRQNIINELKEVIGNRDFQQGGTSGGVTAASAITVLQQAGDKLSRDMIQTSYQAYKKIIYICIELIRQFYDAPRKFRILGKNNETQYISYDNSNLQPQYMGDVQDLQYAMLTGMPSEDFKAKAFRKPEFDLSLSVEKANPFNRAQQNQTVTQLYQMGFFNPQNADMALMALEFMNFEGKDAMMERISQKQQQSRQQEQMKQQQMQKQQQAQPTQQRQNQPPGGDLVELTPELLQAINTNLQ